MKLISSTRYKVHLNPIQRGEYTYWQVSWTFDGRRVEKAFADRKEALACQQTVMDLLESGRPEVVMAREDTLQLFCMLYARIGEERFLELMRAELDRTTLNTDVLTAGTAYLKSLETNQRSIRHRYTVKSHLDHFNGAMKKPVHVIDVHDVNTYLEQFANPKTRNNYRTTLCSLFSFCQRKGWISQRKHAAELSERAKETQREPAVFTPAEMRRMLAVADDRTKVHLVLGGFCGIRSAEIQRMRWEDWQPEHQQIVLSSRITKTGRRRVLQVEANAAKWLNHLMRDQKHVVTWTEVNLNERLREYRKQAKVPDKHNALRHSFATYHLQVYENLQLTSKRCGHSIAVLERNYMGITNKTESSDWFSIEPSVITEHQPSATESVSAYSSPLQS